MKQKGYILIYDKKHGLRSIPAEERMEIGREAGSGISAVILDSPIVSRKHGELVKEGERWVYTDCNSTNGTYINGYLYGAGSLSGKKSRSLVDGDVLRIDCPKGHMPHEEAVLMIYRDFYEEMCPWEEQNLPEPGHFYETDGTPVRLFWHYSRLALECREESFRVWVNQEVVTGPVYLYPMDYIRIAGPGKCISAIYTGRRLLLHDDRVRERTAENCGPEKEGDLRIRIRDRSVRRGMKKYTLLQNINVDVSDGDMILILGGSGAGKTTFMNAVMGYEKADGRILYGDTDIYENYEQMKYKIGFVPQKDLLRSSDRVYDTLLNAAQMKMPRSVTPEQQKERIECVLNMLGLMRERDSLVGKLSGGQRKRLSIAVEFISDPSLFFLDEPDSGLDGIMARSLMENLRQIADEKKIVMIITHAPDRASDLFDKVLVLAKSTADNCGYLAYYGPVEGAYDYFGTDSLEGIVKKINRSDEGGEGMSDYFIEKARRAFVKEGENE